MHHVSVDPCEQIAHPHVSEISESSELMSAQGFAVLRTPSKENFPYLINASGETNCVI